MMRGKPVAVTGIAVMSGLGQTPEEHQAALDAGHPGLRPMSLLPEIGEEFGDLPAGWLEPRSLLAGNRYGPATNFSLLLARQAIANAQLTAEELTQAWLFVGTSRGNLAGWLSSWPGRRGHRQMDTSNSMPSEMAAAVSIEFGLRGPYQVLSNGCASGLDAIGLAYWAVASGVAPRALAIGADLPLLPALLRSYRQTGLLSRNGVNDPYSPATSGFLPGEGGAALVLEPASRQRPQPEYGFLRGYWANSDAYHPLGLPEDCRGIADCLRQAVQTFPISRISAVCPHASGTSAHGQAERRALQSVFREADRVISLHLLKPFTGHTIGASGAVDTALLFYYLRQGRLPPNLPGLTGAGVLFHLPEEAIAQNRRNIVLKISVGLGGHNAVLALSRGK
jgi:3-oxoacyl-[acyl-carrier-protein] synthase II